MSTFLKTSVFSTLGATLKIMYLYYLAIYLIILSHLSEFATVYRGLKLVYVIMNHAIRISGQFTTFWSVSQLVLALSHQNMDTKQHK